MTDRIAPGSGGSGPWMPDLGVDPPDRWGTLTQVAGDGFTRRQVPTVDGDYGAYYENIRDAMRGLAPLAVTAQQASEVMRLIEVARESSRQQRTLRFAGQGERA